MAMIAAAHHLLLFQLCGLTLSAALPPSQSLSQFSNQASSLSPQYNNTTLIEPSNDLPPEDYCYQVASTNVTVKFYHYGDNLRDTVATHQALATAFQDAGSHPQHLEIGTAKLQYSSKHVNTVDVVLLPEASMTWNMWRYAVLGLGAFMATWDNVWLSFDVEVNGMKERVGTGYMFKNFEGR